MWIILSHHQHVTRVGLQSLQYGECNPAVLFISGCSEDWSSMTSFCSANGESCLWAVVQTRRGGCLLMVFAQSGAVNRSCWARGPSLPSRLCCVCVCVDLRNLSMTEAFVVQDGWSAPYTPSPQPVLAFANWQLEFDFAHWPLLHPWKCVVQIRFAECAQHPGAEDGGVRTTDTDVGLG